MQAHTLLVVVIATSCILAGVVVCDVVAPAPEVVEPPRPDSSSSSSFHTHHHEEQVLKPTRENLLRRIEFRDWGYGLPIHFGEYSIYEAGEWVQYHAKIPIEEYKKATKAFNPVNFNATQWVLFAKSVGYKYIWFTSKHHSAMAHFHTKTTDWNVVDWTVYGKDIFKQLTDACHEHGMPIMAYYSHLDWAHPDYYPLGWTGHMSMRPPNGNFSKYIDFLQAQLTEILTNYGEIAGIWFDGWWDRRDADWRLTETYNLIHRLQPAALVGNNHHVASFPGEDFQIFEKDMPGENTQGYSAMAVVNTALPLEVCDTVHKDLSWGYTAEETGKNIQTLVHLLVRAAGHNSNFALNIGPKHTGEFPEPLVMQLKELGWWLSIFGQTVVNGARGGPIRPQKWGVTTRARGGWVYVHVLDPDAKSVTLPGLGGEDWKWVEIVHFQTKEKVQHKRMPNGDLVLRVPTPTEEEEMLDVVIGLRLPPARPL